MADYTDSIESSCRKRASILFNLCTCISPDHPVSFRCELPTSQYFPVLLNLPYFTRAERAFFTMAELECQEKSGTAHKSCLISPQSAVHHVLCRHMHERDRHPLQDVTLQYEYPALILIYAQPPSAVWLQKMSEMGHN